MKGTPSHLDKQEVITAIISTSQNVPKFVPLASPLVFNPQDCRGEGRAGGAFWHSGVLQVAQAAVLVRVVGISLVLGEVQNWIS